MKKIKFTVIGTPAPQGSKSFKGIRNGRAILTESSKSVKPWRQDVAAAALEARAGCAPIEGPVSIEIDFYLARPKSAPKKREYPDRKPDLDKLVRSTLDALVTAGLIRDDGQMCAIRAYKWYAANEPTGAEITVITL